MALLSRSFNAVTCGLLVKAFSASIVKTVAEVCCNLQVVVATGVIEVGGWRNGSLIDNITEGVQGIIRPSVAAAQGQLWILGNLGLAQHGSGLSQTLRGNLAVGIILQGKSNRAFDIPHPGFRGVGCG